MECQIILESKELFPKDFYYSIKNIFSSQDRSGIYVKAKAFKVYIFYTLFNQKEYNKLFNCCLTNHGLLIAEIWSIDSQ